VERRKPLKTFLLSLSFFFLIPASLFGGVETIRLPLVVDYALIHSLLIQKAYHQPGHRAVLLDQGNGCARVEIWEPEVGPEGPLVKTGTRIKLRAGLPLLGFCIGRTEWEGYVEVLQRVRIDKAWKVRFQTVESRFYDANRRRVSLAESFVKLIETYVHPYLDTFTVDLSQARKEIGEFLPFLFPREERPHTLRWVASLRPGEATIDQDAVRIQILMDVDTLPEPPRKPEAPLTEEEVEALTRLWEGWDAFLVSEIESLLGQPLTKKERNRLLGILLSTRSHFEKALKERDSQRDPVREEFISAWKELSPILRKYLFRQPSPSLLNLLAFFSVSDALVVLDKVGPVLNITIGRDGLVRLARLLLQGGKKVSLEYSPSLDPVLRELMGLGPPPDESGPVFDPEELDLPEDTGDEEKQSRLDLLWRFLVPLAYADNPGSDALAELRKWLPPQQNVEDYVSRVKEILEQAADEIFLKNQLEKDYQPLYRNLVLATAWHESCWRQFINRGGKLRYLLSYNQTSVGLMQINERVWRGFYRIQSLRWNLRYNVRAGCEILDLYLREYAARRLRGGGSLDRDILVQVTYGMYNAGPDEYFEVLKRRESDALGRRDKSFWEKYLSSKRDQFDGVLQCLTGG
jgi:hypothetical protein